MSYSAAWKRTRTLGEEKTGASAAERIDEPTFLSGRDLNQADLVEIVVEAVRLGIERNDVLSQ